MSEENTEIQNTMNNLQQQLLQTQQQLKQIQEQITKVSSVNSQKAIAPQKEKTNNVSLKEQSTSKSMSKSNVKEELTLEQKNLLNLKNKTIWEVLEEGASIIDWIKAYFLSEEEIQEGNYKDKEHIKQINKLIPKYKNKNKSNINEEELKNDIDKVYPTKREELILEAQKTNSEEKRKDYIERLNENEKNNFRQNHNIDIIENSVENKIQILYNTSKEEAKEIYKQIYNNKKLKEARKSQEEKQKNIKVSEEKIKTSQETIRQLKNKLPNEYSKEYTKNTENYTTIKNDTINSINTFIEEQEEWTLGATKTRVKKIIKDMFATAIVYTPDPKTFENVMNTFNNTNNLVKEAMKEYRDLMKSDRFTKPEDLENIFKKKMHSEFNNMPDEIIKECFNFYNPNNHDAGIDVALKQAKNISNSKKIIDQEEEKIQIERSRIKLYEDQITYSAKQVSESIGGEEEQNIAVAKILKKKIEKKYKKEIETIKNDIKNLKEEKKEKEKEVKKKITGKTSLKDMTQILEERIAWTEDKNKKINEAENRLKQKENNFKSLEKTTTKDFLSSFNKIQAQEVDSTTRITAPTIATTNQTQKQNELNK